MTESASLPPGYQVYEYDDPFEDHVGPMGYKVVDGTITFAFRADAHYNEDGYKLVADAVLESIKIP